MPAGVVLARRAASAQTFKVAYWNIRSGKGQLNADPTIVGLGPGEAWIRGNSERVRAALDWRSTVTDHNGVSIVARYGLAGAVQ